MFPLQAFTEFIQQHSLFNAEQRVLLAVSGGRDSIIMVHLFKLAGYHCGIAHCNFNLRGGESLRDELFVKKLAMAMDVPYHVTQFNTKAYAADRKISTQMAARDLRYQWFEDLRKLHGYDYVATAHHQDDVIETVLLNLVRGTGIAGMHGILPKRDMLIRPLLFLTRTDIDQLISDHQLPYVEDSSNLSNAYARNKIRMDVIPHLKAINPGLNETFEQNIQRFAETELILQEKVAATRVLLFEEHDQSIHLQLEAVMALRPQMLLLSELLRPYAFTPVVIKQILDSLDKQSGTSFYSSTHRLTINRKELIITAISDEHPLEHQTIHPLDESLTWAENTITIRYVDTPGFKRNAHTAFVDAAHLIYPLIIRTWQEGDKFVPLGMQQFKKLSNFFVDQKVPLPKKSNIAILVNGNGEIIWIAGMRQDNRYKVTATTKKVAIFEQKIR